MECNLACIQNDPCAGEKAIKVGNLMMTESLKNSVCKWRVACEPAVEDEEAGAIVEDECREDCLIDYL